MADVIVSSESMRTLASKIEELAGNYQDIYTRQLYGTVVDNVKKAWKGKDSDAVLTRLEGFHNDFDNMYKVLTQYAQHIRSAANTYDAQQDSIFTAAQRLRQDASNS